MTPDDLVSNQQEQETTAAHESPSFAGKVAFVTGGGSGMGRTTALASAPEGAAVVVADISDQGNEETARMITELGGRALAVRCDVTRSEEVQAALDQAVGAFGRLGVKKTLAIGMAARALRIAHLAERHRVH